MQRPIAVPVSSQPKEKVRAHIHTHTLSSSESTSSDSESQCPPPPPPPLSTATSVSLQSFDESRFRAQVDSALSKMQTILDNTRAPQYPADVPHMYDDKYGLAEFLANTSVAAGHECLAQLGLDAAGMQQLVSWGRDRSVTLRFEASEACRYLRETTRNVESPSVVSESTLFGKSSTKVVTKVVEHFWQFDSSWQLSAYMGTGAAAGERVQLLGRKGSCEIMTSSKSTPRVESRVVPPMDVRITWLLAATSAEMLPQFTIKRSDPACRTPRRNPEVEKALTFFREWHSWASGVHRYLVHELAPIHSSHGLDTSALNDRDIFVPVIPLFEAGNKGAPLPARLRTPPEPKLEQLMLEAEAAERGGDQAAVFTLLRYQPIWPVVTVVSRYNKSARPRSSRLARARVPFRRPLRPGYKMSQPTAAPAASAVTDAAAAPADPEATCMSTSSTPGRQDPWEFVGQHEATIAQRNQTIAERNAELNEADGTITAQAGQIAAHAGQMATQAEEIAKLRNMLAALKKEKRVREYEAITRMSRSSEPQRQPGPLPQAPGDVDARHEAVKAALVQFNADIEEQVDEIKRLQAVIEARDKEIASLKKERRERLAAIVTTLQQRSRGTEQKK